MRIMLLVLAVMLGTSQAPRDVRLVVVQEADSISGSVTWSPHETVGNPPPTGWRVEVTHDGDPFVDDTVGVAARAMLFFAVIPCSDHAHSISSRVQAVGTWAEEAPWSEYSNSFSLEPCAEILPGPPVAYLTMGDDTPPGPVPSPTDPAGAVFYDGFEDGDVSNSAGGVSWLGTNRTSAREMVTEMSEAANSGSMAMRFRYPGSAPGGDAMAEQRVNLGAGFSEVWIEYYLYVPPNFQLRDESPSNNKFFKIYHAGSVDMEATFEYRRTGDLTARSRQLSDGYAWKVNRDGLGKVGEACDGASSVSPLISPTGPVKIGQWNRIRFHFKAASGAGIDDGAYHWWVNGDLILRRAYNFWPDSNLAADATFTGLYLLGWANTGFDEQTKFWIDDFSVFDADPGWDTSCQ